MKLIVFFFLFCTLVTISVCSVSSESSKAVNIVKDVLKKSPSILRETKNKFSLFNNKKVLRDEAGCAALQQKFEKEGCVFDDENPDPKKLCEGKCASLIQDAIEECSEGEDDTAAVNFFLGLLCLKDSDDNYCLTEFENVFENDDFEDEEITPEDLENICSECFFKLINYIFSSEFFEEEGEAEDTGINDIRFFFDLICTKSGDEWCIIKFQEGGEEIPQCEEETPECINDLLGFICLDGCFRKILSKVLLYSNPSEEDYSFIKAQLDFACIRKNKNGDFCWPAFAQAAEDFEAVCPNVDVNGCASTECQDAGSAFQTTLGCCLKTFLDFQTAYDADAADEIKDSLALCNIVVPTAACPKYSGTFRPIKKFTFFNMDWEWAQSHQEELEAAIAKDLAGFLAISEEDVEIVSLKETSGGVQVQFSFQAADDEQTQQLSDEFDEALSDTSVLFPSTAKIYSEDNPNDNLYAADASFISSSLVIIFLCIAALLI